MSLSLHVSVPFCTCSFLFLPYLLFLLCILFILSFYSLPTILNFFSLSSSFDGLGHFATSHSALTRNCKSYRQFLGLLERGSSPTQGRYLHRTTRTQKERRHASVLRVRFELTIPGFEWGKIFRALHCERPFLIHLFSILFLDFFLGLIKVAFFISTGSTVEYQWLRMNASLSLVISCEIFDGGNDTRTGFSQSFFEFPPLIIPIRLHTHFSPFLKLCDRPDQGAHYQILDIQFWGSIYGRHFAAYIVKKLIMNE
jgi:hypothetical protein